MTRAHSHPPVPLRRSKSFLTTYWRLASPIPMAARKLWLDSHMQLKARRHAVRLPVRCGCVRLGHGVGAGFQNPCSITASRLTSATPPCTVGNTSQLTSHGPKPSSPWNTTATLTTLIPAVGHATTTNALFSNEWAGGYSLSQPSNLTPSPCRTTRSDALVPTWESKTARAKAAMTGRHVEASSWHAFGVCAAAESSSRASIHLNAAQSHTHDQIATVRCLGQ